MLSKLGHKVLVLEAAKSPGQCSMTHKGLPFDVSRPRLKPLTTMTHSIGPVWQNGYVFEISCMSPDLAFLLCAVGVPLGGFGGGV